MTNSAIQIYAGRQAYAHLQSDGLQAEHVAVIPAAAGGPKGLILQGIDQWLFGEWLPSAPRQRSLLGASIGSWRMAAASCTDPVAAFERLADLYCRQSYPDKPSSDYVSTEIKQLLQEFIGGHEQEIVTQPWQRLHIFANRGRGLLRQPRGSGRTKAGFVVASLANLASRQRLAHHLERVVFGDARDQAGWLRQPFDRFQTHFCAIDQNNLQSALLASGTLPLIMDPVADIPGAPGGSYWDGGIIDYHLALPYDRLLQQGPDELVLYPHFSRHIIPGWLDKALPWRRAGRGPQQHWLDNVILVAPSESFLRSLPRAKLPDRQDFFHYGQDHQARIRNWRAAISESVRMRDDLAEFVARPDMAQVRPLNF